MSSKLTQNPHQIPSNMVGEYVDKALTYMATPSPMQRLPNTTSAICETVKILIALQVQLHPPT